jgi:hypothetical protein
MRFNGNKVNIDLHMVDEFDMFHKNEIGHYLFEPDPRLMARKVDRLIVYNGIRVDLIIQCKPEDYNRNDHELKYIESDKKFEFKLHDKLQFVLDKRSGPPYDTEILVLINDTRLFISSCKINDLYYYKFINKKEIYNKLKCFRFKNRQLLINRGFTTIIFSLIWSYLPKYNIPEQHYEQDSCLLL